MSIATFRGNALPSRGGALRLKPLTRAVRAHARSCGSALAVTSALVVMPAAAQEGGERRMLEEVVVTAQKRTQNLQDVPISIQVLDSAAIEDLDISSFDDYMLYLPTVSYRTLGPGNAEVYMRGISSGAEGNPSGQAPTVAIYLDEQPVSAIGRNLDVHIYDIERIEVLAGPQGTLYGASAQAGNLRIITNKPRRGEREFGYDLGLNAVKSGDPGYSGQAFANLPMGDRAAIRLVGWYDKQGGYIDAVPATRTYALSGITIDNDDFVEKDFNESTTKGLRAALGIDLNERWSVTPSIVHQTQETDGVWDHDPDDIGDLKVARFGEDSGKDQWTQLGLTVDGTVGNDMQLTYAGSYLDRDVDYVNDYSSYVDYGGGFVEPYYTCYVGYFQSSLADCDDPTIQFTDASRYKRNSHELRLQSSDTRRLRWIVGAFYQKAEHDYLLEWHIPDITPAAAIRDDNYFLTDQKRVDEERALFGELEFDLTDQLTALVGARVFENETTLEGFVGTVFWPNCCFQTDDNVDSKFKDDDRTFKVNLSYQINDDAMVYVTWSEGYRPGGVNRVTTALGETYQQDFVTNWEAGWKATLLDSRVRFNGAIYFMEWDDFQFTRFDPTISLLGLTANVGQAETRGLEFDLSWMATERLQLSLSYAYNDAELVDDYFRTPADEAAGTPQATDGTDLPFTPDHQYTALARYDMRMGAFDTYLQATYSYTDDSYNDLFLSRREKQDSYGVLNLGAGISRDSWSVDLFVKNATDERAEIWRNAVDLDNRITTNRPRSVSLSFKQRF
ncbi:MAG: TonB-dependent receptor [Pseudomonadales bacterium]